MQEALKAYQAAVEIEKHGILEEQMREEQLPKTIDDIQVIIDYNKDQARTERENLEWQLYLDCGKLPNPSLCQQMNTYLHLWGLEIQYTTVQEASKRTYDVVKLLDDLEDLLDCADVSESEQTVANWKWIHGLVKDFQIHSLNVATYTLLKRVETNMDRIDLSTAYYNFCDDYMDLNVWLRVNLPIPLPNPRRPPNPRIDITFPRFVKLNNN